MRRHHETCSSVIRAEAELRACLSGAPETQALAEVRALLTRVVDRLRLLAAEPASEAGRASGLSAWFPGMVERLSPAMRAHPEVAAPIARGLALAHAFCETPRAVAPAGVAAREFIAEARRARGRVPEPLDYRALLCAGGLVLAPAGAAPAPPEMPLGRLRVARRVVHFSAGTAGAAPARHQLATPPQRLPLGPLSAPVDFTLESDHQRLALTHAPRPAWARRMWYDRFGLAAEFSVAGVAFVLRWIPPGRFVRGSPEDEPGRHKVEGPQHEVTISRGFWLGETPVTQAQWRAVVMEAAKDKAAFARLTRETPLQPAPSHFKGPDALPVENVDWHESTLFCRVCNALLQKQFPAHFGFHLPSEAQWEYACRAGTESALYTGGITIKRENNAPELDAIAWYGGNSGRDLEVKNPEDSRGWPGKQFAKDTQAGTHRVKLKLPNAWGLHDMLGNVWEWCSDAWNEKAYEQRKAGVLDPVATATDDRASRVLRGGSWRGRAQNCRAAYRGADGPGLRWHSRGLRLAAGQEPAERGKYEV